MSKSCYILFCFGPSYPDANVVLAGMWLQREVWHLKQMPLKLMTWRGDWHLFAASEAAERKTGEETGNSSPHLKPLKERLYRTLYM
jgi:hypothetical protein